MPYLLSFKIFKLYISNNFFCVLLNYRIKYNDIILNVISKWLKEAWWSAEWSYALFNMASLHSERRECGGGSTKDAWVGYITLCAIT